MSKEGHSACDRLIVDSDLPKELQGIYRVLRNHFAESESPLSVDDLANLFFASRPKDRDYYTTLFASLKEIEASSDSVYTLCKALKRARILRSLAEKSYEASEGVSDAYTAFKSLSQELEDLEARPDEQVGEFSFISQDLDDLLSATISAPGLRWRLNSLNRALGSLRKGNFGFVFARPETGKTTFLTDQASFMAEQASSPIIHLNNEQVGQEVMLRYYQSALGWTLEQLLSDPKKAKAAFLEQTQGRILLYDSAQIHRRQVEKLCELHNPSLLIYDQIDKILGFDNEREDLRLGSIYQWARELSKSFCPSIGVCQSDGTGEGVRFLTMAHVANAKTSKQAEADWILGIGKVHDSGYENLRFFHLSKNKLLGDKDTDSKMRHGKWECVLDPERGRYIDL